MNSITGPCVMRADMDILNQVCNLEFLAKLIEFRVPMTRGYCVNYCLINLVDLPSLPYLYWVFGEKLLDILSECCYWA